MFNDCIILAGGSGFRLWPVSSPRRPKQFLDMEAGKSFFTATLERGLSVITKDADSRVIIMARKSHTQYVLEACKKFSKEDQARFVFMAELEPRNTAPAMAYAVHYAAISTGQERLIAVLATDHIISPAERFLSDIKAAYESACQGNLALLGIIPTTPASNLGYIETGEALPLSSHEINPNTEIYNVLSFWEKPNKAIAEKFLEAGRFFWNSGMFAFSSTFLMDEFQHYAPEIINPFKKLSGTVPLSEIDGIKILENWQGLDEAYAEVPSISFDYAIAEKCKKKTVIKASFFWTDVGSWDEFAQLKTGECTETFNSGTRNCTVDSDIPVALCGTEDLIVVIRSGEEGIKAALIAKKGETQRVRDIIEQIKKAGRNDLL